MCALIAEPTLAPPVIALEVPERTCFKSKKAVVLAGIVTALRIATAVEPVCRLIVAVAADEVMFVRAMFVTTPTPEEAPAYN